MLAEKSHKYYTDEWVRAKEKDLQELQKQKDAAVYSDINDDFMISVAVWCLETSFAEREVPGLGKLVPLERRRTAVERGWCSTDQVETIKSAWCPLPYPNGL